MSNEKVEYVEIPGSRLKVRKDWVTAFEGKITGMEHHLPVGWHHFEVDLGAKKVSMNVHHNRIMELPLAIGDQVKGFYDQRDGYVWRIEKVGK